MKATQQLKDEHEGVKLMLNIIDSISNSMENWKLKK
jgi:hemerythrin-like domain-containing protein